MFYSPVYVFKIHLQKILNYIKIPNKWIKYFCTPTFVENNINIIILFY